jgi:hypothetical protein
LPLKLSPDALKGWGRAESNMASPRLLSVMQNYQS